jgi:hypothetical protein
MNDMCGIEGLVDMHTGLDRPFRALVFLIRKPRALPWAAIGRAVGAEDGCAVGVEFPRTKGANYRSEGQRPGKGNALDTHTQTFKKGLLQQMFV